MAPPSLQALAFESSAPHCGAMIRRSDSSDASRAMARAAEPLRQKLGAYFRRRIPDPSEAEDLVQDVFARIVTRDSTEPVEHLSGYVFQTAASVLADRARRRFARKAEAHTVFDPNQHGEEDFDPGRILTGKEDLRAAIASLLSLPERTRTVFVLHRLEGLRYKEIAVQLGVSTSAVEKHMFRAVQHLNSISEDEQ